MGKKDKSKSKDTRESTKEVSADNTKETTFEEEGKFRYCSLTLSF
jgi:plastocyanin